MPKREAITVQTLPIAELTPYHRNPRKTKNLEMLEKSISGYGFINPIIAYKHEGKNIIVAGHQRLEAAKKQGLKDVPVIFPPFKSMTDAKAYNIMDNRSSEIVAEWDLDFLSVELESLKLDGFDLGLTGFDDMVESFADKNLEIDIGDFDDEMTLSLKFSSDKYEAVRSKLAEIAGKPEDAILMVLGI